MPEPIEPRLDQKQIEAITGFCDRTIRSLWKSGRMPAPIKLGGSLRWNPAAIRAWLETGTVGPPPRHTSKHGHEAKRKNGGGRPRKPVPTP